MGVESRAKLSLQIGCVTLGLASGCFVGDFLLGQPCEVDADCGLRLRCHEGYCGGVSNAPWCDDVDGDGYGDPAHCSVVLPGDAPPPGTSQDGPDCDDGDPETHPGAAELDDPEACMRDGDGDGYGDHTPRDGVAPGLDCDDDSDVTFPGAAELDEPAGACMRDGDDDGYGDSEPAMEVVAGVDCDDRDPTAFDCVAWSYDGDGDGYGSPHSASFPLEPGVEGPIGYVANDDDCDDADPRAYPGAAFAEDLRACMLDNDGDGYGNRDFAHGPDGQDCDDDDEFTAPGKAEHESSTACMTDQDGDGYGKSDYALEELVDGRKNGWDCDDDDPAQYNCITSCPDSDGDGYGDHARCSSIDFEKFDDLPLGFVQNDRDCDDHDSAVHELCVKVTPSCAEIAVGEGVELEAYLAHDLDLDPDPAVYEWSWEPSPASQLWPWQVRVEPTRSTTYAVRVVDGPGDAGGLVEHVTAHLPEEAWVLEGPESACERISLLSGESSPLALDGDSTQTCAKIVGPIVDLCAPRLERARASVTLSVATAGEDAGPIGVVWGWRSAAQFYLLSWARAPTSMPDCSAEIPAGVVIKRVDAAGELALPDLACAEHTANVSVLMEPGETHDQGWVLKTDYDIELDYDGDTTQITIREGDSADELASFAVQDTRADYYAGGQFGSFAHALGEYCAGPWHSSCLSAP